MTSGAVPNDPFRTGKAYTIAQAAKLARTYPKTVRNWIYGSGIALHHAETAKARPRFGDKLPTIGPSMAPVFGGKEKTEEPAAVSFLELAEIIIVADFRRLHIRLDRIRTAHENAKREFLQPFPFASLTLKTLGGHVLHHHGEGTTVLSALGQAVLPGLILDELERFDFAPEKDPFALRWYPYGRKVPVVVDPRFAGGRPSIKGYGITLDILKRRRDAGQDEPDIAREYSLPVPLVRKALQPVT